MIAPCPRCGGAIPMDVAAEETTAHRERGECPACRFVLATATTEATEQEPTGTAEAAEAVEAAETEMLADGGHEVSDR